MTRGKKNTAKETRWMMCTGCGKTVQDIERACRECEHDHPKVRCSTWYYKDAGGPNKPLEILFHNHSGRQWAWVGGTGDDKYRLVCSSAYGATKKCKEKTCCKCSGVRPPICCDPNRCVVAERVYQRALAKLRPGKPDSTADVDEAVAENEPDAEVERASEESKDDDAAEASSSKPAV